MATRKLSEALKALTTPEFGFEVEMPDLSIAGTSVDASAAELNFVDGVTSAIQTQLNNKDNIGHTQSGATITTNDSIVATRYPLFSTTSTTRGAVPGSSTATGSQVLADNGWKKINNLYTAFQSLTIAAGTATWTMADGYNANLDLTEDTQLAIADIADGMTGCLIITQGGGFTLTLPNTSYLLGSEELVLTSAALSIDILTFVYHAPAYYWSLGANYKAVLGT